tara:strand:+ start:325 stop:513 length:189 start_codon:yes stop_codon:yes gene_type:complete
MKYTQDKNSEVPGGMILDFLNQIEELEGVVKMRNVDIKLQYTIILRLKKEIKELKEVNYDKK